MSHLTCAKDPLDIQVLNRVKRLYKVFDALAFEATYQTQGLAPIDVRQNLTGTPLTYEENR